MIKTLNMLEAGGNVPIADGRKKFSRMMLIEDIEEHPEIQEEVKLVIKRGESLIFRFLQDGEEYKVKAKVLGITNDSVELEFEQKLKFQLQFLNKD